MWRGSAKSSELPCKSYLRRKSQVILWKVKKREIAEWPMANVMTQDLQLADCCELCRRPRCHFARTCFFRQVCIPNNNLVDMLKNSSTNCRAPPKPRDPAFNAINVDDSDYEDTFQVWLKIPCRQKPWLSKNLVCGGAIHVEISFLFQEPPAVSSVPSFSHGSVPSKSEALAREKQLKHEYPLFKVSCSRRLLLVFFYEFHQTRCPYCCRRLRFTLFKFQIVDQLDYVSCLILQNYSKL